MISIAHSYAHSFSDLWSTCSKNAPVIQEPVSHIRSAKERRIKCKDNLACGKIKRITAVTQRGRRKVRISNLVCLVSLAQIKRKQTKSWQNKYWFQQESEWFVFRSSWNSVKATLWWQSCLLHMRKAVTLFFTIFLCFWARQSGPLCFPGETTLSLSRTAMPR